MSSIKKSISYLLIFCITFVFNFGILSLKASADEEKDYFKLGFKIEPASEAKVGSQVNYIAEPENFDGEDNLINWCVFGRTFQSVQAGSEDTFVNKDGQLGNKYGNLVMDKGMECSIPVAVPTGDTGWGWLSSDTYASAIVTEPIDKDDSLIYEEGTSYFGGPVAVKRTTKKDNDPGGADGMDDDWEIRYFRKFAGKTVERGCTHADCPESGIKSYTFPEYNPENPGPFLDAIKPYDDFDNDGWMWEGVFPKCESCGSSDDCKGEAYRMCHDETKDWIKGKGYFKNENNVRNASGIPSADKAQTGDGKFTNYEEYVFGLDPTNSDTDGDNIIDEADVAGLKGGTSVKIPINDKIGILGRKIGVLATIYGKKLPEATLPDTTLLMGLGLTASLAGAGFLVGSIFPGIGNAVGAAVGAALGALITGIKWIAGWFAGKPNYNFALLGAADLFTVGGGKALQVNLTFDPEVPTPENKGGEDNYSLVEAKADVSGIEKGGENVYYRWYLAGHVQDKSNPNAFYPDASGYGKDTFRFAASKDNWPKKPGDSFPVSVEVLEETTGKTGTGEKGITLGENITEEKLAASLIGSVAADQTVDPCALNPADGDYFTNVIPEVNKRIDDTGEVRADDIIQVEATLDLLEDDPATPEVENEDSDDPSDFIYTWYLDGNKQIEESGQAKTTYNFIVSKTVGQEHRVGLELTRRSDGFGYGQLGEKVFTVQTPSVDFEITGDIRTESGEGGATVYYIEPLGEVKITATSKYFQPTYAPSFHYIWKLNDKLPQTGVHCGSDEKIIQIIQNDERLIKYCETTVSNTSTFTYQAGETEDTADTISLTVENYIDADTIVDETATNSITITVKSTGAIEEARGPVTRLFAQAGGAISSYFKNIFNIVLSIGIIGFIVFVVMAAGEVKKRR